MDGLGCRPVVPAARSARSVAIVRPLIPNVPAWWERSIPEHTQSATFHGQRGFMRLVLDPRIRQLDEAVERAAQANRQAQLLMTQPGVGPITALAYVLTIGDGSRFQRGKQVASYLGLIPSEKSSSNRRRLGSISKQGNSFLRMLLVESAQAVNRLDEGFRQQYKHRCHHMAKGVAKVAAARRLAVRLFWMLRSNTAYPEIARIESSPR